MTVTRTSIAKPDVKVTIEATTTTPTQATPALPACVVGPCYQVLDPQLSGSLTANTDAYISLPAMLRSHETVGASVKLTNTVTLTLSISGTPVTATFSAATWTLDQIITQINTALVAANASAVAEKVLISGTDYKFVLRTTSSGSSQYITWYVTSVVGGEDASFATTMLKLPVKWRQDGMTTYNNERRIFGFDQYPDPLSIIDYLDIDTSTVRAFGSLSAGLSEWLSTTRINRCGNATIQYLDDGDGDGYTPIAYFDGVTATPHDEWVSGAYVAGPLASLVDFTTAYVANDDCVYVGAAAHVGALPADKQLVIGVNGLQPQNITIESGWAIADTIAEINKYFPSIATNAAGKLSLDLFTLSADLDAGMKTSGSDSVIYLSGSAVNNPAANEDYLFNNGAAGLGDRVYRRDVAGAARAFHPIHPGDKLYVNGELAGTVLEVSTDRLKLDTEHAVEAAAVARNFYIVSCGLPATIVGTAGATGRPAPDLFVGDGTTVSEPEGTVQLNSELLRQATDGMPLSSPFSTASSCYALMGYTGLRLDVTTRGLNPDLISYSSTTDLATDLTPINTTNPLALGMYYAMLNSTGITTYGLGVHATSTAEPNGTLAAYTEAAEMLESKEIYSIVPLTYAQDVADMFQIHVDAMSDPDAKAERILWCCMAMPTREYPTVIASGAEGNCADPGVLTHIAFNTNLPDLGARFVAAGITASTFTVETDLIYCQLSDGKKYAVKSYTGPSIELYEYSAAALGAGYTGVLDGVFEADFWTAGALIDEAFTVGKLGASLTSVAGVYDKTKAANAIWDMGQHFADRRVRMIVPDQVNASIGGVTTAIPGYYACCALAGMKAYHQASQGFTNMKVGGITGVQNTQGYFTESQLNLMAGGGAWILVPGPGGNGVETRMSLTTDTSTVEYRQDSWTSAFDYAAKYLRTLLRRIIGPTSISQQSIDLVATICDGAINYLVKANIWAEGSLSSISQSSSNPNALDVSIDAAGLYDLLYINVTISV